jgi:serine protease Do
MNDFKNYEEQNEEITFSFVDEESYDKKETDFSDDFDRRHNWHADDFETTVRNSVPKSHALSIYRPKEKKFRKLLKRPVFAAVLSSVVTSVFCFGLFAATYKPEAPQSVLPPSTLTAGEMANTQGSGNVETTLSVFGGNALTIPQVYDKASPAVVSILVQSQSNAYIQSQETMSSGSGIIIRQDGYIVTNNHVVEGAGKVTVNTIGGDQFDAKIIGTDARTDLAVLKIENDQALPFAELGDSSQLRVGDMALAIGNPLREELAGTLTVGYISAINRSMIIDGKQMTMLQTDAAINPGNSGGALLNMYGQVIGINTAKSTGYDIEGLGFAIPINEAKPIIESIIKDGYVTGRPLIGLIGRTVTEAISKAQDLPIGVYVSAVTEYGAAEKAGIQVGDVIIECEGKKVTTVDEINKIRDEHKPGDKSTMKISRMGKKKDITVTLQEEKPEETQQPVQSQPQQQFPQFPSDFFSWFGW